MKQLGRFSRNILYILLMTAIAGSYSLIGYVVGIHYDAPVRCKNICAWTLWEVVRLGNNGEEAMNTYVDCYPICMGTDE